MNTRPMLQTCHPLILASASPRRIQMLSRFGIVFDAVSASVAETPAPGELPEEYVRRLAAAKAHDVGLRRSGAWIIGADTAITLDGRAIIGKPADPVNALQILQQLSGRTHQVLTGICLCRPDNTIAAAQVASTRVTFIHAANELLQAYIATGEPLDKAGAYGIQGLGSFLVREINGSCANVIGLPISSLLSLLLDHEIIVPRNRPL
ncbi:MAG: nucleoside triphosphate pyrophosphatase [Desulfobulbaceae bacterium]|nr:nucleoside triphosphate pyrophosphatase [Desulfobulbaceae bacterium]